MSEFEKQKQEIIHAIGELQEVYVGRKTLTQIYAMINQLKPPAPPAIREDIMQLIEGELISLRESQTRTGGIISALRWVKSLCEVKNEQ